MLSVALLALVAGLELTSPRSKLEQVEKGLSHVVKSEAVLADLVQPMVDEVQRALKSTNDTVCEEVLAKFPKWQEQLQARQEAITKAGDGERTSLLVAVLQNRQNLPIAEQLEVANSADFEGLPVVAYINAHHDKTIPLVKLAVQFMDMPEKKEDKAEAKENADPLAAIEAKVEEQVATVQARVEILAARKERLDKILSNFTSKHNATKKEGAEVKFLITREERKIQKQQVIEKKAESALKDAVKEIRAHNIEGVKKAQEALKESMVAAEAAEGTFLHFLQMDTPTFSCPYCGAQCLEKCHSLEHKSMGDCLNECTAKDPKPDQQ